MSVVVARRRGDPELRLTLAATNDANPCGGPFKELAETVLEATGEDKDLHEGDRISVTVGSLGGSSARVFGSA